MCYLVEMYSAVSVSELHGQNGRSQAARCIPGMPQLFWIRRFIVAAPGAGLCTVGCIAEAWNGSFKHL